jgi:hypothetical protein
LNKQAYLWIYNLRKNNEDLPHGKKYPLGNTIITCNQVVGENSQDKYIGILTGVAGKICNRKIPAFPELLDNIRPGRAG